MRTKLFTCVLALLLYKAQSICPDFWTRFHDSCYLFVEPKEKWHSATNSCRSLNGHLVEIDSLQENIFLMNEIRLLNMDKTDAFWTGGNDIEIEGIWKWADSFKSIDKTFWAPHEPNAGGVKIRDEDCINLPLWENLGWNDENCDRLYSYICEIEDGESGIEVVG